MKVIKRKGKIKRKLRVRKKVFGTAKKPRLSVFRSNKYIYGQLVDDKTGTTLADVQAQAKKLHEKKKKIEAAFAVGQELARIAKEKKINEIVFDRGSYRYHGRVKSFADGVRDGGLKF